MARSARISARPRYSARPASVMMIAGIFRFRMSSPLQAERLHAVATQAAKQGRGGHWRSTRTPNTVPATTMMDAIERSMAPVQMMPVMPSPARITGATLGPQRVRTSVNDPPCFIVKAMAMSKTRFPASRTSSRWRRKGESRPCVIGLRGEGPTPRASRSPGSWRRREVQRRSSRDASRGCGRSC